MRPHLGGIADSYGGSREFFASAKAITATADRPSMSLVKDEIQWGGKAHVPDKLHHRSVTKMKKKVYSAEFLVVGGQ
jgi:hypothetical protein